MKPDPRLLDPSIYPHSIEVSARFSDVDPQQHLNNARLVEFYQEARLSFYQRLRSEHGYQRDARSRILVAHLSVDYLGEVDYPGSVVMRLGVTHIGRSSHTTITALFAAGRCAGLAKAVLVYGIDGAGVPIPDELRALLSRYQLPQEPQGL
ncbi:MAG: thioesterase family protein [Steroidobacteraceae bacterium]